MRKMACILLSAGVCGPMFSNFTLAFFEHTDAHLYRTGVIVGIIVGLALAQLLNQITSKQPENANEDEL